MIQGGQVCKLWPASKPDTCWGGQKILISHYGAHRHATQAASTLLWHFLTFVHHFNTKVAANDSRELYLSHRWYLPSLFGGKWAEFILRYPDVPSNRWDWVKTKKAMDINRISMINSSGEIIFKAVSLAVPEDAFEGFLNYIKNSHEKRKTEPFCIGFAPHTFQSRWLDFAFDSWRSILLIARTEFVLRYVPQRKRLPKLSAVVATHYHHFSFFFIQAQN